MKAIEFDHIGKQYRLGLVSTRTLSHDLNRWWAMNVLHREDPYLKIGETNDRSHKGHSDYVWALKDINFSVEEGDVVGKMTGRENIYMNGAIMGMTKAEITRKLDEIVDFSGCERYIDTPVKRYSSGMTVRLGFAIAAHLEPEILVVDEVLAVGDAEFQKKAIGKMQDVSKKQGRTVLFVSHNMSSIQSLCNTGIVLDKGQICFEGTAEESVAYYTSNNIVELRSESNAESFIRKKGPLREIEYMHVRMLNDVQNVSSMEPLEFECTFKRNSCQIKECQFGVLAKNESDNLVWAHYSDVVSLPDNKEIMKVHISIPYHNTPKGRFNLNFNISRYDYAAIIRNYDIIYDVISFEINFVDKQHSRPFAIWPFRDGCSIHESEARIVG